MDSAKEQKAIERLKTFVPEDGYYLAYSGGKDSDCIKILAQLAGVTAMNKTCSNCKHAIGFGPLHNNAIYAFCEKRSGVTKDKVLIVNRKNKCYAWEKRSDEDNA
jgi:tRNA(Ile)-lysidine synthase TilS/MesJ